MLTYDGIRIAPCVAVVIIDFWWCCYPQFTAIKAIDNCVHNTAHFAVIEHCGVGVLLVAFFLDEIGKLGFVDEREYSWRNKRKTKNL